MHDAASSTSATPAADNGSASPLQSVLNDARTKNASSTRVTNNRSRNSARWDDTGTARNIFTDRLTRLVERGILDRSAAPSGRRQVYTLTAAGRDLFTVVVALREWGERHAFAPGEARSELVDRRGLPPEELTPTTSSGRPADADSTSVQKAR